MKKTILCGLIAEFKNMADLLAATRLARVAYVGPMREISIVFGVFIGARFLGERLSPARMAGVGLILLGILTIKLVG